MCHRSAEFIDKPFDAILRNGDVTVEVQIHMQLEHGREQRIRGHEMETSQINNTAGCTIDAVVELMSFVGEAQRTSMLLGEVL
jgi:hypothetical protein